MPAINVSAHARAVYNVFQCTVPLSMMKVNKRKREIYERLMMRVLNAIKNVFLLHFVLVQWFKWGKEAQATNEMEQRVGPRKIKLMYRLKTIKMVSGYVTLKSWLYFFMQYFPLKFPIFQIMIHLKRKWETKICLICFTIFLFALKTYERMFCSNI